MAIKEDQCCEGCCSDLFKDDDASTTSSSSRKATNGCCTTDSGLTDLQYKLLLSFGIVLIILSIIIFSINVVIVRYQYYFLGVFVLMDPIPNIISILIGIFCILSKKQGYLLSVLILTTIVFVFGVLVLVELGFNIEDCKYTNELYDDEKISKEFCRLIDTHIAFSIIRQLVAVAIFIVTCIVLCKRTKAPLSSQQDKESSPAPTINL